MSACGELARLGLVTGTPEPAAATSLYDWDLATAALAASHAVKRQLDASQAHSRLSQQPLPQPKGGTLMIVICPGTFLMSPGDLKPWSGELFQAMGISEVYCLHVAVILKRTQ